MQILLGDGYISEKYDDVHRVTFNPSGAKGSDDPVGLVIDMNDVTALRNTFFRSGNLGWRSIARHYRTGKVKIFKFGPAGDVKCKANSWLKKVDQEYRARREATS